MSQTILKVAFVIAVAAAVVAGGFAWRATSNVNTVRASEAACQTELAECGRVRDENAAAKDKALGEAAASSSASRAELEELRAERAEADKRLATFRALTEKFRKMIDSGKLQVILRHGRMVVKLPASVLFASGHAELSKEGKDALHDVAGILRQMSDRRFMAAGHTDNVPVVPPSPFKNNLELSTARALTVAQQLIASGMSPARLVAAGYAEFEPVRENTTEAGRQENRRIEIVLLPNVTELPLMPGEGLDGGAPDAARDAGVGRDGG